MTSRSHQLKVCGWGTEGEERKVTPKVNDVCRRVAKLILFYHSTSSSRDRVHRENNAVEISDDFGAQSTRDSRRQEQ